MYLSPFCTAGKHGVCLYRYGHNVCECDCHDSILHTPSTSPALRAAPAEPETTDDMLAALGSSLVIPLAVDGDTDRLTYSQRAVQPLPPAPRRFWIEQVGDAWGAEYDAADVPRAFTELFNQMVSDGTFVEIRVEEQPF
jgi:hypothetical protein